MARLLQTLKRRLSIGLSWLTARYVALRWRLGGSRRTGRPSGLDLPVVVSLTSYPPRYPELLPTLTSLLMQTIKPDFLELWIAEDDFDRLPAAVLALRDHGLLIKVCPDLRSYKKIIPALGQHPDALIVTADDDAYYWPTWLEELVDAYDPNVREVLCHRAHQMVVREGRRPAPYSDWVFDVADTAPSPTIFPTGVGGILYRPGIFMPEIVRQELFQKYCPTNDDIWFYWMALLNGARFRKVGPVRRITLWPRGQASALFNTNVLGASANDGMIAAMVAAYGFPLARESA